MDSNEKHLKDLIEIRSLMEKSSRFLSLSGLSGIFAGTFALLGALNVCFFFSKNYPGFIENSESTAYSTSEPGIHFILLNAVVVLILALLAGWYFSRRKAARMKVPLWNSASKRMLGNLFIPLMAGGILCIIFLMRLELNIIVPLMLIFYGLGLINAGKYTEESVNILGLVEIVTGILAIIFINNSLLFWSVGFGLWHIIYGIVMYFVHEKAWL